MTLPRPGVAIAVGGFAAGVFDLIGAFVVFAPAPPAVILRSIAAGLVGPAAARAGGPATTALGLLAHFTVALGAAAVFVAAGRRVPALTQRVWLIGPLYGLAVFLVMNYVVIPWSAIGRYPGAWTDSTWQVLAIHLAGVGPPIVLAARRWAAGRSG
ncbi:MAG: hypothetical protein AB7H93_23000 [Vicinamibacterales bacterium]